MKRSSIVATFGLGVLCVGSFILNQGDVSAKGTASAPAASQPGELTLELGKGVTMRAVLVPAGKFLMGSPGGEKNRQGNEGPQREVTISKPFHVGVHEVTQEQYEAVMGKNPGTFKGAKNPVEGVSWEEAVEFCKALSRKTGRTVTLPTEAQWEYACRAGSRTAFSFGDDSEYSQLGDYAWYGRNSRNATHPVGQKKPNAWGLYDMHGNVWEWCGDWYAESYAKAGARDPQGPDSGTSRVLRGGGWSISPPYCRSAYRMGCAPGQRSNIFGFRVVIAAK